MSDNGTAFTSVEFQTFMKRNGIRHVCCAPYHPSSNGQAGRAVQTFKEAMKKEKGELMFVLQDSSSNTELHHMQLQASLQHTYLTSLGHI